MLAIVAGHPAIARCLLDGGADVDVRGSGARALLEEPLPIWQRSAATTISRPTSAAAKPRQADSQEIPR